jgi:hypothetical protein
MGDGEVREFCQIIARDERNAAVFKQKYLITSFDRVTAVGRCYRSRFDAA